MSETFTPYLRLFEEELVVNRGSTWAPEHAVLAAPVAQLFFDYGGTRIAASDRRDAFFRASAAGMVAVPRDRAGEREACGLLESFGAVEVGCVETLVSAAGNAHYLIDVEGDVDAVLCFGAVALPELGRRGWRVEVSDDYPVHVVGEAPRWCASVEPRPDGWFDLELGIDVGGERVDLLPVLLQLLRSEPGRFSPEGLGRSARPFMGLPLGKDRYLPIEPARLRNLLQVLVELYELEEKAVGQGRMAPPEASLAALERALPPGSLTWVEPTETVDAVDEPPQPSPTLESPAAGPAAASSAGPVAPAGLQADLRPYQRQGFVWMQGLRAQGVGGILADDMGLGKTLQTIAHLLAVHRRGRGGSTVPSLVVVPTSLVGNWLRELHRFAPTLSVLPWRGVGRRRRERLLGRVDVVVTTYGVLVRDLEVLAAQPFSLVVLDEAQTIKNPQSQAHRAVCELRAEQRLCLTGTPIENGLVELWSLMEFLAPGLLGSRERFRQHYEVPIERDRSEGRLQALRAKVAPLLLRRLKTEVARDLPPKTEIVRTVELLGDQRDLYESIRAAAHAEVRKVIHDQGIGRSALQILDALLKLRQVCCDGRLVALDAARQVRRSCKLELLTAMLREVVPQGRRVLVFSQFTSMLALISEELRRLGLAHVVLTGDTADRDRPVARFQAGEVPVFLLSLKAGGTGLNLTAADTVIHYDPWWNPAAQAQATDRAYRIGQDKPVFVYSLVCAGSVEERILALQERKRGLADSILGAGTGLSKLSVPEVEDLFAPLERPAAPAGAGATQDAPAVVGSRVGGAALRTESA